jgi:hypothetical protein
MARKVLRIVAYVLALAWAGLWVFFGLASGIGEGENLLGLVIHTAAPGLVFLISALIAFKWEMFGGYLLIGEGLAVLVGYPISARHFPLSTIIFVLLTMALPPLLSGIFLIICRRKSVPAASVSLS